MTTKDLQNPFKLGKMLWPNVTFYGKQRRAIESAFDNDETYVAAANMMGKDFTAGFICTTYFLTRYPCRIVTTSAKDDHLRVLWGEISRFIQTSKFPLEAEKGGPLIINHKDIRRMYRGQKCPISYLLGMVASPESMAAMQGHHVANVGDGVPRTMFMTDESSSVSDEYYRMASTWANRMFMFGNTWPCENFFKRGVQAGDQKYDDEERYYRKVIKIRADESPNVRFALMEIKRGLKPSGRMLVPGVKSYAEYVKNRKLWDEIQQCVCLDAEFYEGKEVKLFTRHALRISRENAVRLKGVPRKALAIGIDPAEGGDKTTMTAADELGIIEQVGRKTPDTDVIVGEAAAFAHKHGVPYEDVLFDLGGGGRQHADRMRKQGMDVRTVAFGGSVVPDIKRGQRVIQERVEERETRYTYKNRRAEMFGEMSLAVEEGWAIPEECSELHRQLALIPKMYDSEGRLELLSKSKKSDNSKELTLIQLIGHSPDESDSAVLAYRGVKHRKVQPTAGAF